MTFTNVSDLLEDVVRGMGDVPVRVSVRMREQGMVMKMTEDGLEERIPCVLVLSSGEDTLRIRLDYVRCMRFSDYAFGERMVGLLYTLGMTEAEKEELDGLMELTRDSGWDEWYAISSKAYRQLMRDMNVISG